MGCAAASKQQAANAQVSDWDSSWFPLRKVSGRATMLALMAANDTSIVILAAGKGTRLRSELAKVLHRAGGRPILETVVRACQPLQAAQILVVVGHQAEQVAALAQQLGVPTPVQTV